MCIIHACPKGTPKDTDKVYNFIKEGFCNNKEGSGFMFKRSGESTITVSKGYFDIDPLIDAIKKLNLQPEDELVVHHRRATHGKTDIANCHPFIISSKHEEIIASDYKTRKPALMHNGVFRGIKSYIEKNPDYSDTYAFTRYFMANRYIMGLFRTDRELFKTALDDVLANARLAILHPSRDLEMHGNFIKDGEYFHSNDGYYKKVCDIGGSSWYPSHRHDSPHDYEERINAMIMRNHNRQARIGFPIPGEDDEHPDVSTNISPIGKKEVVIKYDGDEIEISQKNCKHFYFIDQMDWENNARHNKYTIQNWEDDAVTIMAKRVSLPGELSPTHRAINTGRIKNAFYYIPVNDDYKQIYSDLAALKTLGDKHAIGPKTIKSLDKMINKSKSKEALDNIYYDKLGDKFTKMSLSLYRDWLVKERSDTKINRRTFAGVLQALESNIN